MTQKRNERIAQAILLIGSVLMIYPFLWMALSSFKSDGDIIAKPMKLVGFSPTLEHYENFFASMNFWLYLRNTLIIVVYSFGGLLLSAAAGFGFAKQKMRGREVAFTAVLATMMIPGQLTMIPTYLIISQLGLINTYTGIVLPGLVGAFAIFLFRQFIRAIPDELLEAARCDGMSELGIFLKIILPLSKPILAVQGIFTFIGGWNSFFWPLIIANDQRKYPLSLGLMLLRGQNASKFGLQLAGCTMLVIPIIIVFVIFQKHIINSYVTSGIK